MALTTEDTKDTEKAGGLLCELCVLVQIFED